MHTFPAILIIFGLLTAAIGVIGGLIGARKSGLDKKTAFYILSGIGFGLISLASGLGLFLLYGPK